jgi:TonB family protein
MRIILFLLLISLPSQFIKAQGNTNAQSSTKPQAANVQEDAELSELKRLEDEVLKLFKEKKYKDALKAATPALSLREKKFGADSLEAAIGQTNVGIIYQKLTKFKEAISSLQRAIAIYETKSQLNTPDGIVAMKELAFSYFFNKNDEQARKWFEQALASSIVVYGADSKETFERVLTMAHIYRLIGETGLASRNFVRAVEIANNIKDNERRERVINDFTCFVSNSRGIIDAKDIEAFNKLSNPKKLPTSSDVKVLNGRAISLPKPSYPREAYYARASGTVVVKVTIDETGKVIEAKAICGHPLLVDSAIAAARSAKFTPTLLDGKAVKVTGTINYNFLPR